MAALGSAHGVVATCPFGTGHANRASSFQLSHESPGTRSLLVIRTFHVVIVPTGPCPGLRSVVNTSRFASHVCGLTCAKALGLAAITPTSAKTHVRRCCLA